MNHKPAAVPIPIHQQNEIIHRALAFYQSGRLDAAARQYKKLLGLQPDHAMALTSLGTIALQQGQSEQGISMLRRSLEIAPDQPEALNSIGNALSKLNRLDEALASYQRAIALSPGFAQAWSNRGNALHDAGRPDEALASYERAIAISPGYAAAWCGRGNILLSLNPDEALASYERAIALSPGDAESWFNHGNALRVLNRQHEALASYDRAIALQPDFAQAWSGRGNALGDLKRSDEALASYDQAIALKPDFTEAWSNRGTVLSTLNRPDEALASYDRAIALRPDVAQAWSNRGAALNDLKRRDEALASYERAIALDPGHAAAWWNKSLMKLMTGDYEEGWRLYEWRRKVVPQVFSQKRYPQPHWLGEQPLSGKTLLIHPEQGLGDYLHFIRYALLAEQRGAKVILEVPSALRTLVSTLNGQFRLISKEQPLPDFDYHCPVMSLPLAFSTRPETIPAQIPYLFADKSKQAAWQQRLGKKSGYRVGLVWSGKATHANDHNRSIALAQFAPLFDLPAEFHSLQKEVRPADAQFIASSSRIKDHQQLLHDFSDTAALIEEMDLVIAVDTSVAHLAGALGKEVWILLPYVADYRWMLDREDSPWYPGATLFRQPVAGDWATVINRVREALKDRCAP